MNPGIEAEGTRLTFLNLLPFGMVTVIDSSSVSDGLSVRVFAAGLIVIPAGAALGCFADPRLTASLGAAVSLAISNPLSDANRPLDAVRLNGFPDDRRNRHCGHIGTQSAS